MWALNVMKAMMRNQTLLHHAKEDTPRRIACALVAL